MSSNYTEYYLQLVDTRLGTYINDSTGLYTVLQAGVPLAQTVYSDAQGTALTLPATMSGGKIRFFTASSTTSVDLSVMTSDGRAKFLEGVTATRDHRIDVDTQRTEFTLIGAWAILSAHPDGTVSAVAVPVSGGLPVGIRIKDVFTHTTSAGVGVSRSEERRVGKECRL